VALAADALPRMTEVAFHLHVGERHPYVGRLLRKAYGRGARVHVLCTPADLEPLDRSLWLLAQGEFLPHALDSAPERVLQRTPIVLGTRLPPAGGPEVLINLAPAPVLGRSDLKIIEVVGSTPGELEQARERWRLYKQAGMEPVAHDLSTLRP
jgi:DNA polymerase-3 subunit chi